MTRSAPMDRTMSTFLVPRTYPRLPRTVNQDLLARLNVSFVAKTLQCGDCRNRYRSRLLKRHVIRLHDQCSLGSTHVLGTPPTACAEHFVARFEVLTFLPTASTWPAISTPSRVVFGLRSPAIMRRKYGVPLMKCQSYGLTEA